MQLKPLFTLIGTLGLLVGQPNIAPARREPAQDVQYSVQTVQVNGQKFRCNVVKVNWKGRLIPRLVTAQSGIGRTEAFGEMVRRVRGVAAINGSFFDAYNTVGDKDPGMTLIRNGQIIHKGTIGSVLGFGANGAVIGRLDLPIRGIVDTGTQRRGWYAYWINRTPTAPNNIAIFTPARGGRARVSDGLCVIVNRGVVQSIVSGDTEIPPTGFLIHLRGDQMNEASKFAIGARVSYEVLRNADRDSEKWQSVSDAVGAGPRLLTDGQVAYAPEREGFSSPKILSMRGMRSAVGLTQNDQVLLVTTGGATVREMADILRKLGAYQAMNLDGGASSGLYCNGQTLTAPGRLLSNALVFCRP